jgi:hypothetical protein
MKKSSRVNANCGLRRKLSAGERLPTGSAGVPPATEREARTIRRRHANAGLLGARASRPQLSAKREQHADGVRTLCLPGARASRPQLSAKREQHADAGDTVRHSKELVKTMKLILGLLLIALIPAGLVSAQEPAVSADQRVETLRAQLFEVQTKETELQTRASQLEEALKPENIERSLAGIGSTKPEELRELRQRQLTIERDGVLAQLKLVGASRERLESAIRAAEADAYLKSAEGNATFFSQFSLERSSSAWRSVALASVAGVLVLFVGLALLRRAKTA